MSSATAEKCAIDDAFKARAIKKLPEFEAFGILQERRKRIFDFTVALTALIFLLPFLVIIALLVRATSNGPAIFKQSRYGRFKKKFTIYKFRTMTVMEDGDSFTQCRPGDCRVTPLGAFLRRTSLDELPQLWNVVKGDMSLVGPRPHAISMDDEFSLRLAGYDRRFLMRPGITGLAQCQGFRGNTERLRDMAGRLCRDIYYVRNRTMMMDVGIIVATIVHLLRHDAY
ncbi:MAG: sugar transferase [Pseudomonadota bacterium]